MKIQCDVCKAESATVFCCADEAALCAGCDSRVHSANKLAGKHRRISLSSSDASPPLCDICQEKRGFIFCQEDRAVLCKDCDEPIHSRNDLTKKHNRFLLAGDRLSSTSMPELIGEQEKLNEVSSDESNISSNKNNSSSSTISEYLIKTLPGWQVEDLLEDDTCDFFLTNEIDLGIAEEELPKWTVPQVPQAPPALVDNFEVKTAGLPERWSSDDHAFRVPQISAMNAEKHKRARTINSNSTSMPSSSFWYY